jgi:hypothetical protein
MHSATDLRTSLPYHLEKIDWNCSLLSIIRGLDCSLSGTKRPKQHLATTTLFRVYTTFFFQPLQRRCFRTRMAIREPRCHTYKIACINHALALSHEMPWHSTVQCAMSITRLGYISVSRLWRCDLVSEWVSSMVGLPI